MRTADDMRAELLRLGQAAIKRAKLPAGFNAVIVVTDSAGEWLAVSSSDDEYTYRLLKAALEGSELRTHRVEPILTEGTNA